MIARTYVNNAYLPDHVSMLFPAAILTLGDCFLSDWHLISKFHQYPMGTAVNLDRASSRETSDRPGICASTSKYSSKNSGCHPHHRCLFGTVKLTLVNALAYLRRRLHDMWDPLGQRYVRLVSIWRGI